VDPTYPTKVRIRPKPTCDERDQKEYNFHRVFPSSSTQEDVYDVSAKAAMEDALKGYQGLVFVYGQTGTGKTHTLCNLNTGQEGILFRSVKDMFARIESDKEHHTYEVKVSFVQIYSEVVEDLLSDQPDSVVTLREDPTNSAAVELHGCQYVTVTTMQEALQVFKRGDAQRAVGDTCMNDKSSRSHCIFTLYVTKKPRMTDSLYESKEAALETRGRLTLVDLAGSERAKKAGTDASGREDRLREATFINKSLLTLGRVVHTRREEGAPPSWLR
jgi:kinesin family protein 5